MELSEVLKWSPELLFQDALLDTILSKVDFSIFFDAIYSYPNIYLKLSSKQDYWKLYYTKHYHNKLNKEEINPITINADTVNFVTTNKINWFYEILLNEFSTDKEYYYNTYSKCALHQDVETTNVDNTGLGKEKLVDPTDPISFFSMNNKLKYKNIKDVISTFSQFFILFNNGDVIYNGAKFLNNIKMMLRCQYFYFLNESGNIHCLDDKKLFVITLPIKVKYIQREKYFENQIHNELYITTLISIVDFNDNL